MKLMMKLMYRDDEATAVDAAAVQYQFELLLLSIVDEADRESGLGSRAFLSPRASGKHYFLITTHSSWPKTLTRARAAKHPRRLLEHARAHYFC